MRPVETVETVETVKKCDYFTAETTSLRSEIIPYAMAWEGSVTTFHEAHFREYPDGEPTELARCTGGHAGRGCFGAENNNLGIKMSIPKIKSFRLIVHISSCFHHRSLIRYPPGCYSIIWSAADLQPPSLNGDCDIILLRPPHHRCSLAFIK